MDGKRYVVVLRQSKVPSSTHATLEAAANKVYRDRTWSRMKVMVQEGLTASAPLRELTLAERKRVERALFPSLHE